MNKQEFEKWCYETGYSTINDWNYQEIDNHLYYFIKNYDTGLYALIKYNILLKSYDVLIQNWTDYNGWNE